MGDIQCPNCGGEATYRYGKSRTGKERHLCLLCNRQFVPGSAKAEIENRPACPVCGKKMHVYMRQADATRFRCSDYPKCRTFQKIVKEAERRS